MAATAVMGTQQAGVRADRKVDGVFALWYGKGPGVDRAGDALHHGNAAGASRHGGVLVVVGDDHTAVSSSIPHASEASLIGWQMPVVHPASIDEYEDRKSTRLNSVTNAHLVCRLLLEKINKDN